jgi:dihydrofolate synthase / folylpolyglutamate synthase
MPDHAFSTDPAVQAQLNRLTMLSPGRDVLGLERISALMDRLGNPHRALPPVFHVSGTNGKGSTCAFLRAAIEAAGLKAHVYSSPHLVRFNERIRVAGRLIDDAALAPLLAEVLDCSEDIQPSFFEATTAAAFLAFARTPADAAIIEVGLGGRLDATNIIETPTVCGIAALGIDHKEFLLSPEDGVPADSMARIAFEKAGIAKANAPLVTHAYDKAMEAAIADQASKAGAQWIPRKQSWDAAIYAGQLHYRDETGKLSLPLPDMAGAHQADNAALAVAMLRHQSAIEVPDASLKAAMKWAHWPARLQKLSAGPLTALAPNASEIWLDGGHNLQCAERLAEFFSLRTPVEGKLAIICGMLANKDAEGFVGELASEADKFIALPVPGHAHHLTDDLAAIASSAGIKEVATAPDAQSAMRLIANRPSSPILICGSLYLAGEVLEANGQLPD